MATAAANLSTEIALIIDDPSIFSSIGAGVVSVLRWLPRGVPYFAAFAVTLVAGAVLLAAVAEVQTVTPATAALARRRRQRQRLWRRQRSRLLKAVTDVPYGEQVAAVSSPMVHENNPCVICRAEYEAGERCGVLPQCAHVFHKDCIAAWLRHHTTCPICNAPVLLKALAPPQGDDAFYY